MDQVPEGGQMRDGTMCRTWLRTLEDGVALPTAFIVDGTGRIAWFGHTMGMEKPLESVVAGTWDNAAIERVKTSREQGRVMGKRRDEITQRMKEAQTAADFHKIRALIERTSEEYPAMQNELVFTRFHVLWLAGEREEARTLGENLLEQWGTMSFSFSMIASTVATPHGEYVPDTSALQWAQQLLDRARQVDSESNIDEAQATVYAAFGDYAGAIAAMEQAIAKVHLGDMDPSHIRFIVGKYRQQVEEYRQKAEAQTTNEGIAS